MNRDVSYQCVSLCGGALIINAKTPQDAIDIKAGISYDGIIYSHIGYNKYVIVLELGRRPEYEDTRPWLSIEDIVETHVGIHKDVIDGWCSIEKSELDSEEIIIKQHGKLDYTLNIYRSPTGNNLPGRFDFFLARLRYTSKWIYVIKNDNSVKRCSNITHKLYMGYNDVFSGVMSLQTLCKERVKKMYVSKSRCGWKDFVDKLPISLTAKSSLYGYTKNKINYFY